MLLFNRLERYGFRQQFYFNTSNVTIQHRKVIPFQQERKYFNTSNVTIQYRLYNTIAIFKCNFNTSNVTIQQEDSGR